MNYEQAFKKAVMLAEQRENMGVKFVDLNARMGWIQRKAKELVK